MLGNRGGQLAAGACPVGWESQQSSEESGGIRGGGGGRGEKKKQKRYTVVWIRKFAREAEKQKVLNRGLIWPPRTRDPVGPGFRRPTSSVLLGDILFTRPASPQCC